MPPDRLLATVLRAYQSSSSPEQTQQTLSATTSLLTTLSNPLNITLLTSYYLTAPAIWNQSDVMHIGLRTISCFNTAAITVRKHELEGQSKPYDAYLPRLGGGIGSDDWARAVVKGLDEKTPRWQHILVLVGVLLGMEGQERYGLSRGLRRTLEGAIVTAANRALETPSIPGTESVILALNHSFPLLSERSRRELNYDALLITAVRCMTLNEGYQEGLFLEEIDGDVKQVLGNKFDWSPMSPSFLQLQKVASKPLVSSMGPLSRLIAHSIENCKSSSLVLEAREQLFVFSSKLLKSWQRNKLSEIDSSEEAVFLTPETLRITFPMLWQTLKTAMFAIVVILRAVIGRTLIDVVLSSSQNTPVTASQTLFILRNIHFISSRFGSNAFSAYTFVSLASIDLLTRFPSHAIMLLQTICPSHAGRIPPNPLQRNLDLSYLNTVEHFTLLLSPSDCEKLVIEPCTPYLSPSGNSNLLEIFEAAHSAMLSVFSAPQNAILTATVVPFYTETLFASFPRNLSPRQFRFAFKTLIQICTPPNPVARSHPLMAETLLEVLYHRALAAPTTPLPPSVFKVDVQEQPTATSEQAVLLLTLLDTLPNVTLEVLELWLPQAAELLNVIQDRNIQEACRRRFWEVLESGEMDVERSAVCVGWWGTRGGRQMVLEGGTEYFMSGGLGEKHSRL